MKRIKYIMISGLSVATLLLGMSSCSNLDELADTGDGTYSLAASSSSTSVSTRADESTTFEAGTHYYLYALDAADPSWSANYMNATPDANYTDGVETSGKIVYTGNNRFSGKTLNFYGVTESSKTVREFITPGGGTTAPTVSATYTA